MMTLMTTLFRKIFYFKYFSTIGVSYIHSLYKVLYIEKIYKKSYIRKVCKTIVLH